MITCPNLTLSEQLGDRIGAETMKGICKSCADCKNFGDPTYCTDLEGCKASLHFSYVTQH